MILAAYNLFSDKKLDKNKSRTFKSEAKRISVFFYLVSPLQKLGAVAISHYFYYGVTNSKPMRNILVGYNKILPTTRSEAKWKSVFLFGFTFFGYTLLI